MANLGDRVGGLKRIIGGPFGSNLTSADYVNVGVPVIRGSNMEYNGRWIGGDFAYVSGEKAGSKLRSNIARRGDIIVTQRGTMGQVSIVPDDAAAEQFVISQSQMAISVDENIACRDFVYYYLRSPQFSEYLSQSIIQTGVPHINLGILRQAPALWPGIDAQRAIAAQLSNLDDKIELNRRMNQTLEEMAQAIFRDWFVDFGPAHRAQQGEVDPVAIMGGLTPNPDRAAHIAALFPGAFDNDGLPVGWRLVELADEFNLTMGQSPPGHTYNDVGIGLPFFQGRTDFGFRYPDNRKYCSAPTRLANADDTLISVRAPVGDLNMAWEKCCIGRGVAAARHKSGASSFTFYTMRTLQPELQLYEHTGTVFGAINRKQFEKLPVIQPSNELVLEFEKLAGALDQRLRLATEENRTLAETRDYLLPRLMSGSVRVAPKVEAA